MKKTARGGVLNVTLALPVLACPAAVERTEENDSVEIGLTRGEIRNLTRNTIFKAASFPDFIRELVSASGLVGYGRRLIAHAGESSGVIRK